MKQVAVWDTYVPRKDGQIMHFDIIVPVTTKDPALVFEYGLKYLRTKGLGDVRLTTRECSFCHVEILQPSQEKEIEENGFVIVEIQNCD